MTTISPAYAAKLRRLQELLPGAKILDPCPDPAGDSNGHRLHSRCHGTSKVVPPLEVAFWRMVLYRGSVELYQASLDNETELQWVEHHYGIKDEDNPHGENPFVALLDAMLAALGAT